MKKAFFLAKFHVTNYDDVVIIRMNRALLGQNFLHTYAFIWKDTLIDTGISCCGKELLALATEKNIKKVYLTHHHEDHSGSASFLQKHQLQIFSSAKTKQIMESGFSLNLYQKIIWGEMQRCSCQVFEEKTTIGEYNIEVISAPGHSEDQVVFYVPQKKWLFAADLFIHDKIKFFRRDEDFAKTISSLKKILSLDFKVIFCSHRSIIKNGKPSLQRKLEYLLKTESRVRELYQKGWSINKIAHELAKPTSIRISFGDVSTHNLVRSIISGPTPRKDIQKILDVS